jgi:small GTP-binding protein
MAIHNFKVVLIGDSGVGKTSIVSCFIYQKADPNPYPTIGGAFCAKEMYVANGKKVVLKIWDTAGQERFRSITKIYYKNAYGCLCVFDLTNRASFNNLNEWINEYKDTDNKKSVIIILANKADFAESKWAVSRTELDDFAAVHQCEYLYTNCINGTNIDEAFEKLAAGIVSIEENTVKEPMKDSIKLHAKEKHQSVISTLTSHLDKSTCKCQ